MVIASIIEATASDLADAAPASTEPVDVEMKGNRGGITTVSPSLLCHRNSKLINTGYWQKLAGSQQQLRFSPLPQANQWGSDGKWCHPMFLSFIFTYYFIYFITYFPRSLSSGVANSTRAGSLPGERRHTTFLSSRCLCPGYRVKSVKRVGSHSRMLCLGMNLTRKEYAAGGRSFGGNEKKEIGPMFD